MNIKGCIGCNHCWLITPGKCSIQDDYEELLISFLQADRVIFVTDTYLGFVSYRLKNIIDCILPLLTMHLRFKKGQMRHFLRYKKHYQMGLIYCGEGHHDFLQQWFSRVMLNLDGTSLGVYHISQKEEIKHAFINH